MRLETRIVPIVLQECDHENLSWTLGLLEMVDFSISLDAGLAELLKTWGLGFDKSLSNFHLEDEA